MGKRFTMKPLLTTALLISLATLAMPGWAKRECISGNCWNWYGVEEDDDGDRYEGDFVNGKRTGKGVKTYASGTVKSGIWEDGEFVGTVEEAAEQKATDDRIYRACLLDKSRGQDMSYAPVRQAVESTCEEISKNPSWLDKLEY